MKTFISLAFFVILTSCLKEDIQNIDKVSPGIIRGHEIQEGKYMIILNRDLDNDMYNDTSSYEFIAPDTVISIQTDENGSKTMYGTWKRVADSGVVMTFKADTSGIWEIFSNAFIVNINDVPNLLLSPLKLDGHDSSSIVGYYYSTKYIMDSIAGDNVRIQSAIKIYDTGEWASYTGVTVNKENDYVSGGGYITESEITSNYYQLIEFQGDYFLFGLYTNKFVKVE